MTGGRLARLSLRFDAIYCLVVGLVVAGTAPLTANGVALSPPLLIGVGGATFLWGAYVWWASCQRPIRTAARVVMIANIAASLGLATTGLVAGTTVLTLAAFPLSIDVAAFAVSQGTALRRLRDSTIG
ncbi:hypothetical protein [Microbacterium murale]|uniref:Integral membrane protein n=1 Tax=Microbacterium murale TaxID=1081040 RepID=A0ABQ1RL56_9MICO|nr:hypothetical protein [Microbacterium murale]GGD70032.1 hypothetical protein GCM10007269_11560 [Microbacterium murale]